MQTPRISSRAGAVAVGSFAIIVDEKKRLLLAHRIDKRIWHVPGGKAEADEAPWETARREAFEEVGLTVEVQDLLGVTWQKPAGVLLFDFLCRPVFGVPTPCMIETDRVGWFEWDQLPQATGERVRERLQGYLPALPTKTLLLAQERHDSPSGE